MMPTSPYRRAWVAIGLSAAMVVVLATLFPRLYLANDDVGFTEYLRKDTFTPWISPVLSLGFRSAYHHAPGVPWWGLYQYALIIAIGAVLFHTLTEVIDRRPGLGHAATLIGALVLGASHAILVVGITWTTVSISALGTAAAAFVAHAQLCHAEGKPMSRARALIYGLIAAAGYMLRLQGLGAMIVALLPLFAWAGWRFLRSRHLPRPTAVLAFVAPFALVVAVQGRVDPGWVDTHGFPFDHWTNVRGAIHGHTAFEGLDTRGPELLERTGWGIEEYRDFTNWLIIDEADYPSEKIERLLATGGVPEPITPEWNYRQLRTIYDESSSSVALFICVVIGGVVLALLGAIDRARGLAFCIGYLVFLVGVPLWMAANYRFPQRVSLSFYSVAALGAFLFLARSLAERPAEPEGMPRRDHRRGLGLAVVALCMFVWARNLLVWIDRDPWPDAAALQALEDRIAARGGFVFVYVQAGLVGLDPLRAEPRAYDGLQGGWGTFSTPWYGTIREKLGVSRGADVLPAMVDNPQAYLLTQQWARDLLEDWIKRKLHDPSVRLAIVDGADFFGGGRPELYRLVTAPLQRDSDEWKLMARYEWALAETLPGPPSASTSGLGFRPVAFAPPYTQYLPAAPEPGARIDLAPVDGGVRATVTGELGGECTFATDDAEAGVGHPGGVRVPVAGLHAARFSLKLIDPDNIVALNVYATTKTSRALRWRWILGPQAQRFGYAGTFTLVPGYPARQLGLATSTAEPGDVRDLHVFIVTKPGTRAGFELRNLEVAEQGP